MGLPRVCVCGWVIPGDDEEQRFNALRVHSDEVHADYKLPDHALRDFLSALERMDPPLPRLDSIAGVEVHRVTPDRIPDVLDFFDHYSFADNPIWASCYCMAHHVGAADWEQRSGADNRRDIAGRLEAGATTGYLAYVDGKGAGWCNASSRDAYPGYEAHADSNEHAGAIVCFLVASPYRRHGVANALLESAIDGFRSDGFRTVEAYPRRATQGDDEAYHGPLKLYLDAGFEEVGEAERWVVVRKQLA